MLNWIHRWLYSVASSSPVLLVLALVLGIEGGEIKTVIIVGAWGVVLSIYGVWLVSWVSKHAQVIPIAINEVQSTDMWVFGYIISYIAPLFSLKFDDLNPWWVAVTVVILGLVLVTANIVPPNPVLLLLGYHFYNIGTVSGVKGYYLLSKRKSIHNGQWVKEVTCIFDYLLVEKR